MIALLVAGLLIVIGILVAVGARWSVEDLKGYPSCTCDQAAGVEGPARFGGEARCEEPLFSPLTGKPCVHYSVQLLEEVYDGNTTRMLERVSRIEWARFWIADGSGALLVEGEGAEVAGAKQTEASRERLDERLVLELTRGYGPALCLAQCTVVEKILPVGAQLFVRGEVRKTTEVPVLAGGQRMLVSALSEKALFRKEKAAVTSGFALVALGILVAVAGLVFGLDHPPKLEAPNLSGPLPLFKPAAAPQPDAGDGAGLFQR